MALWNGFLSSVTNGDDRNLLLALAVRYGFFLEQDGWHIESRGRGEAPLSFDEIRTCPYVHHVQPLQYLCAEDTISLLFGRGPKRTSLPESFENQIVIDQPEELNLSQAVQADQTLSHMEHSTVVLQSLLHQKEQKA